MREIDYVKPKTVSDALSILTERRDAKCLAGGQTLVNVMKHRFASPGIVVDLNGLNELRGISVANNVLTIGAMSRYVDIAAHPEVRSSLFVVSDVADHIADRQVRNRGTIGGNCCFNDPTSNFPPLLSVLDASCEIAGLTGRRTVAVEDFFIAPYQTAVRSSELLYAVHIPIPHGAWGASYLSLRVGNDGPAILHVTAFVVLDGDVIRDCRVSIGCIEGAPYRARQLEHAIIGLDADEARIAQHCTAHLGDVQGLEDVHATASYREDMSKVYAKRVLVEAVADARRRLQ